MFTFCLRTLNRADHSTGKLTPPDVAEQSPVHAIIEMVLASSGWNLSITDDSRSSDAGRATTYDMDVTIHIVS